MTDQLTSARARLIREPFYQQAVDTYERALYRILPHGASYDAVVEKAEQIAAAVSEFDDGASDWWLAAGAELLLREWGGNEP